MRPTSFIAAVLISAAVLSSSVDNAATAVAFARPEPARFRTYHAIDNGMKRRTLYKRAPQRSGKDDDENQGKDEDENRNGDENENRDGDRSGGKGTDRDDNRSGNRGDESGTDRDDDRQNNNGKDREDDGKAKNDEDDERNAKSNQDPATSDDDAEDDESTNSDVDAENTAADDTVTNNSTTANETSAGDSDSNLYNNGPSSVNTKGVQNGTVIAAVAVSALLIVGASVIVFMRKKKHDVQTEAIIEKSATAFAQQSSEYETLEDDSPPPVGTFKVISTFVPNLADELDVELGDTITVLVEYDDGWVQGMNERRGGAKGVMPRHCLNMSSKYGMNKRSSSIGFTNVHLG